jgi:hypothetical protein
MSRSELKRGEIRLRLEARLDRKSAFPLMGSPTTTWLLGK